MPQIIEETTVNLERFDLHRRSPIAHTITNRGLLDEPARTRGIHLSGVLRYLALESGVLRPQAQKDVMEDELPLRMALGLAWEEFAVSLYPEIAWQPGETVEDEIVMTCDGHSAIGGSLAIEEFKLTWKKARSAEDMLGEWYWMQQGRGYCWGYGAAQVRWHVCYINGDYRGSGPLYKRYLIEFSEKDIDTTRNMILGNKQRAIEKGYCE